MGGWGCLAAGNKIFIASGTVVMKPRFPFLKLVNKFVPSSAAHVRDFKGQIEVKVLKMCCSKGLCRKLTISLF